ncbi:MAG TPA: NAD(P)H-hydrate dehydratase [Actinomycetota bacterium]|nr:NAD(P)H-hydrate dehydratase [Actinomycetota bacterium]
MQKVLTPGQMAAADSAAAESGIATSDLMDRAGRAVGRTAVAMMGGVYGRRVTVVCGKGNNAGDGFVAATYLARRGAVCNVVLMADPAALRGDALGAYRRMLGSVAGIWRYDAGRLERELERSDLAIDAMVGTGFKGALSGPLAEAADLMDLGSAPVLAVDIPSGVNGETGAVEGFAVGAARTVTLAALKTGLLLQPGAQYAGEVTVEDIGIPDGLMESSLHMAGADDLWQAVPERQVTAHKRSVGKVLVVAGSVSMAGAAALTASGALRAGAGLVRMAVPVSIRPSVGPLVIEALTAGMPETGNGAFSLDAVPGIVNLARQMQVVALGPGIGKDDETLKVVREVLAAVERPVVLDADGIAAYQGDPEGLRNRPGPTILTPHSGELGRLLGRSHTEIDADRISSAREAADRTGAVVLLKGFRTVVAEPGGMAVMVDAGGPILATGGSGDVLTGVIAALAAGVDPFKAAWGGALLHGLAGETLAQWMGNRGAVAGDLLKALPLVIHEAWAWSRR